MSSDIWDGFILIVIGMLVVFAALVILMLAIQILNKLFPDTGEKTEEPLVAEAVVAEQSVREKVAVLAVALAIAKEKSQTTSKTKEDICEEVVLVEAGRWAVAGREGAMHSRQKAGRRWGRRSD